MDGVSARRITMEAVVSSIVSMHAYTLLENFSRSLQISSNEFTCPGFIVSFRVPEKGCHFLFCKSYGFESIVIIEE